MTLSAKQKCVGGRHLMSGTECTICGEHISGLNFTPATTPSTHAGALEAALRAHVKADGTPRDSDERADAWQLTHEALAATERQPEKVDAIQVQHIDPYEGPEIDFPGYSPTVRMTRAEVEEKYPRATEQKPDGVTEKMMEAAFTAFHRGNHTDARQIKARLAIAIEAAIAAKEKG